MLALSRDKDVVHLPTEATLFEHEKDSFQSKQSKCFTKETSSINVKPVLIRYNFHKLDPM